MQSGSEISKARRACAECKAKKLRCVPSREVPGVCSRWVTLRYSALFNHPKLIPRLAAVRMGRTVLFQRQCDLGSGKADVCIHAVNIYTPWRGAADHAPVHTRMLHLEEMMRGLVDQLSDGQPQHTEAESRGPMHNNVPYSVQDGVLGGVVGPAEAKSLCDIYRKMSHKHFPCILVPERMDLDQLQRGRPMLLQAMLVVASFQNRPRQAELESIFLKDLGEKFFMQCERSLDLIQGLLVYLTWYV